MKVNDFAVLVTMLEGKKKSIDIAQVKETLKIVNDLTERRLYEYIRNLDERELDKWKLRGIRRTSKSHQK